MRMTRLSRHWIVGFALAMFLPLAVTVPAGAVEYSVDSFDCGGARGSGQADELGNFYVPCGVLNRIFRPHIRVYDANGAVRQVIEIDYRDGDQAQATDVAPSPDGSHLYVMRRRLWRLNRQPDGSYVLDRTWKLQPFPYPAWGGKHDVRGEFVATDALGFLYLSSGTWYPTPNTVVKYSPTGRFVTNFGEVVKKSWDLGHFYWMLAGLTVTRDGRSVYTAEVGNNRIQRFDQQPDGTYRSTLSFGNTPADDDPATPGDEARDGICDRPGRLAAPYDVAVDRAGDVYVINASCFHRDRSFEAIKFTADGKWITTVRPTSNLRKRIHGIAIDKDGNVYLAQANRVLRPTTPPRPLPGALQLGPAVVPRASATSLPWVVPVAAVFLVLFVLAVRSPVVALIVFTVLSFFPGVPEGFPGRMKAAGLGLAIGWFVTTARSHRSTAWRDHPVMAWSAALLCAWAIASTLWAKDSSEAFSASTKLVLACGLAGLVYSIVPDRRTLRRMILAFVAGATLTTLWGLAFFPGARSPSAAVIDVHRLTGGVAEPNDLAVLILPAIGLALFAITTLQERWQRLTLGACLVVLALGLILTQSRGAFVGAVVMLFFATLAGGPIRTRAVILAGALFIAGLSYYVVLAPQTSVDRIWTTVKSVAEGRTPDGAGRLPLWSLAWEETQERPLLGVGAGNFRAAAPSHLDEIPLQERPSGLTVVHNTPLEVLAELGLVGLLLFAAVVLGAMRVAWTTVRRASEQCHREDEVLARGLLVALAGALGADLFRSGQYDIHLWLLLGLAVASSAMVRSPQETVCRPTTDAPAGGPSAEPANGASPKEKIPPSAATSQ
jgi:O-antigen ligase